MDDNTKMLDFAQNVNSLSVPKGLKKFVFKNSDSLLSYPDPKSNYLNLLISKFLEVKKECVTYVNGSTEIFFSLPKFLGKQIGLIIQPTFWEYEVANKKVGVKVQSFQLRESQKFRLNIKELDKKISEEMVVYLCNPNNPTSTLIGKNKLLQLISKHKNTIFVVDETYLLFRKDYSKITLTMEAQSLKNLYVASSLSKIFALPGIRAGFLVSNPENIRHFTEWRIPYSNNSLSEVITTWLLKQTAYIGKTRTYYQIARKEFFNLLKKNFREKILFFKPEANFILGKILTHQTSTQIVKVLKRRGILVRDGAELSSLGNKWIRFTIKQPKQNKELMLKLGQILI